MSQKREKARAALIAWRDSTSPEQFIAQHAEICFPKCKRDVRVELVSTPERLRKYYCKIGGMTTNESHKR